MKEQMPTKDDIAKINIQIGAGIIPKQEALAEGMAAILEQLARYPRGRAGEPCEIS